MRTILIMGGHSLNEGYNLEIQRQLAALRMEQDFKVVTSVDDLNEEEKASVIELEGSSFNYTPKSVYDYPALIELPEMKVLDQDIKSGQELRRERRAKKRRFK